MTDVGAEEWVRRYAVLALRVDRALREAGVESSLLYQGDPRLQELVAAEDPPAGPALIEDCAALAAQLPEDSRGRWTAAQLTATRAIVRRQLLRLDAPPAEHASDILGLPVGRVAEDDLAAAHDRIAAALPPGSGGLTERLQAWQHRHELPAESVTAAAHRATEECLARTRVLVELPGDIEVDLRLEPGANRGAYLGRHRGTLYLSNAIPVCGADLVYVVAHETFPGHIAEQLIKDDGAGARPEYRVRLMLSPPFLVSEGIGLHAPQLIFPGDEGQRWLHDHVLGPNGIQPDGSDFAAIHAARNELWGAWGNAALLAAEGRPDSEVGDYLRRWGLLGGTETAWAISTLKSPGMQTYVLGYVHGWRLLQPHLTGTRRHQELRHLLSDHVLPADL